jgi:hypothetical protein
VADVLEAVTYVAGVDPMTRGTRTRAISRTKSVASSRLLAVHALREICDLSQTDIARALDYADHTTPRDRLRQPVDYDELRAVVGYVAEILEDEDRAAALNAWG